MQSGKSHKVLVVEDEGLIALDIASRLEALGHEVIATVGTAEEAIEKAAEADIVLMDIRLDGPADGIEAAAEIRDRFHVPVVFLTGQADRSTLDRAKLAEPFGYIVKPLAPASLQTNIEVAVYKHGMDRKLEEREAWLSTTLSSVADAVIVTDVSGRVRLLNRAAEVLTGWIQPEAAGQPVSKIVVLLDKDFEQDASDPVPLAILRDAPVTLDGWTLVARGGREMSIEGSVAPVKAAGVAAGAVLTLRDASARRWEERQLRQSQKLEAASRLAAGVSSDYAGLLAVVRNQAEQLLRQFGDFSPARAAAEQIQQAATQAERLTRRLEAFSTRQVSHQEALSLNAIVRRCAKFLESVAGPKIELSIRPHIAAGKIRADAAQIEQALTNLVLHACATMPDGGRLLIETGNAEIPVHGRMASYVLLAVTHTGTESDPEKLFEPVFAGDEELALPMVHAIATEHGGYVSAQPTAGGGCRFEMLLPRWSGAALVPRPEASDAPSILLIDPRARVRSQLHNFFEANGYNLLEAGDGGEALALSEVHEGALQLLIADEPQADAIAEDLRRAHPEAAVLRIVERAEATPNEIRFPFTQQGLLKRVEAILKPSAKLAAAGLESATAG
jgi:two-component system, cell cycle sensor histidine kinase and response regulator CckA